MQERKCRVKVIGYNRTSTKQQHLDRGDKDIREFCKERELPLKKIYSDKCTGRNFNRPRYIVMKEDALDNGDILIVPEADRLGRTKADTLKELQYYKEHGIRVMILDIPTTLIDFNSMDNDISKMILEVVNNMLIEMYAVLAQAEVDKKAVQQKKGIQAMKERGDWDKYGRPKLMTIDEFAEHYMRVERGEIRPFELIKELGLTEPTYYRYRKKLLSSR